MNAEVIHGELERARKRPGSPLSTCTACPGGAVPHAASVSPGKEREHPQGECRSTASTRRSCPGDARVPLPCVVPLRAPRQQPPPRHPRPLSSSTRIPAHMDVQLHVLPLAEPRELVAATKHREGQSEGPLRRPPPRDLSRSCGTPGSHLEPPPGDTDLRPDLEVTSPESLPWGPTPLELLTKKGGGPDPPQGWETLVPIGLGHPGRQGAVRPPHLSMNFWKMPPRRFWQISSM